MQYGQTSLITFHIFQHWGDWKVMLKYTEKMRNLVVPLILSCFVQTILRIALPTVNCMFYKCNWAAIRGDRRVFFFFRYEDTSRFFPWSRNRTLSKARPEDQSQKGELDPVVLVFSSTWDGRLVAILIFDLCSRWSGCSLRNLVD